MKFIKWKVKYQVIEDDGSHETLNFAYKYFTEALTAIKEIKSEFGKNVKIQIYPIFMTDDKYESLKEFEGV